jgi:acyl-CoA synthetase (NDP forming)
MQQNRNALIVLGGFGHQVWWRDHESSCRKLAADCINVIYSFLQAVDGNQSDQFKVTASAVRQSLAGRHARCLETTPRAEFTN